MTHIMLTTVQELEMVDAMVEKNHWDQPTAIFVVHEVSLLPYESYDVFWKALAELLQRLTSTKKITPFQKLQARSYIFELFEGKTHLNKTDVLCQINPYLVKL